MHNWIADRIAERPWRPIALEEAVPVEALPTPALVLNRPAFARNLTRMQAFLAEHGKAPRPHGKTHKCPIISHAQIDGGAVGLCVAKVGEAVAQAAAGVTSLLVTSPTLHPGKVDVLANVAAQGAELALVVDSEAGAHCLADRWPSGVAVSVLLDIDVQMGRTGNRDAEALKRIAALLDSHADITVRGAQHYAGNLMHIASFAERRQRSLDAWSAALEVVHTVFDGLPEIITGCGTGTFDIDVHVPEITDLQVGSYIFMDREYLEIEGAQGPGFTAFEPALSVVCTAISAPTGQGVTVDGGYKAFASDSVTPLPLDLPDAKFYFAGDEHGVVVRGRGDQEPLLGRTLSFMVPHCDPTVNLHDYYYVQEDDGHIHELWPITGRGASF